MISVIIPTCNRNDLLRKCLDKLFENSYVNKSESFEVIISDDSKNNIAKSLIETEYRSVKWVEGPKLGPAANRNNGAYHSNGDWLLFIDDDCLPSSYIISEYYKAISAFPEVRAFEGRIFVDEPQTSLLQESPINNQGGKFWSCNICLDKNLFLTLKGFDQHFPFPAMEDVDLFKRIQKLNIKSMFLYEASVLHPWRMNRQLFKATLNRFQSHLYYISKFPEEKENMGASYFFMAFTRFTLFTFKNAVPFKFSGFRKKLCSDFLLLYFGIRVLLKIDKEYRSKLT